MNKMKRALIAILGLSVAYFAETIHSADSSSVNDFFEFDQPSSDLYSEKELSLDAFGFGATRDKDGNSTTAWGPGVGINYFFTRNLGAGADTYSDAFTIPYNLNFSGIFRYPIADSRFAVYGIGGFGRQWKYSAQWLGHVGAGGEYRFNPKWSFFTDIRGEFPTETKDYALFRFGFRIKLN